MSNADAVCGFEFQFQFSKEMKILKDGNLDAKLVLGNWGCEIKNEDISVLDIKTISMTVVNKKNKLRYLLIPTTFYIHSDKKNYYESIIFKLNKLGYSFDKYVFLEPFEFDPKALYDYNLFSEERKLEYAILPVSITEVDSFRRLQKILLEQMFNVDSSFEECAFCQEKMTEGENGIYSCKRCRTTIERKKCRKCKQEYNYSYAQIPKPAVKNDELSEFGFSKSAQSFFEKEREQRFRSVTNVDENGKSVCPKC